MRFLCPYTWFNASTTIGTGHHLEKELRANKAFSGMSVTTAINESDDSKVLITLN
jgi:hypothetical protein